MVFLLIANNLITGVGPREAVGGPFAKNTFTVAFARQKEKFK